MVKDSNEPLKDEIDIINYLHEQIINIESTFLEIIIPKGYMNCGVSCNNSLCADTNDSSKWDTFQFPLPTPKHQWKIYKIEGKKVTLIDEK